MQRAPPPPPPTMLPTPSGTTTTTTSVSGDAAAAEARTLLFRLSHANEAGFVVGAGGRNASLILKITGVPVRVDGEDIYALISPAGGLKKESDNMSLAHRMAFSMSAGGVLRWFVTPTATAHGYPTDQQAALRAIAEERGCELQLLRSRRGHMCLLLIVKGIDADAREKVRTARDALLLALTAHESKTAAVSCC
jgi:hypothetical protein